jgi:hypothetical protein
MTTTYPSKSPAYRRHVHRRQGYGTWQPYVDAEPARQHILNLRSYGIGHERTAELAGLPASVLAALLYEMGGRPRRTKIRPETEAKILSVQARPELIADGQMIDGTGTRRRLQALAAAGYPFLRLGEHLPLHPAQVGRTAVGSHVHARTARAVTALYDRLKNEAPTDHGITPGAALKARNRAAREGWREPAYWDDMGRIDDADFDPAATEKPLGRNELAALRREEILHLTRFGATPEQIKDRLSGDDLSLSHIRAVVAELRTGKKADRSKPQAVSA